LKIRTQKIPEYWIAYKRYIVNNLKNERNGDLPVLDNWQNNLFCTLITYIIPSSIVAVFLCIIIESRMGHYATAGFDFFTIAAIVVLMLTRQIPVGTRRLILVVAAVLFSLISAIVFGYYTVGAIYLFGVSIFVAYQFSTVHAYLSLFGNLLIWFITGTCLYYNITWTPASITTEQYILFISNLAFLNLMMVIIIRQTLQNLDLSILQGSILHSRLEQELAEVAQLNSKMVESEANYKALFFLSPLPKWIYDIKSKRIIQVNNAAVTAYGYSEEELLKMSISDFTTNLASAGIESQLYSFIHQGKSASMFRKLLKKNGEPCYVEINWSSILYEGKASRIVVASDITEKVNYLEEINHQNAKLKEIAFMQTHVVRSPLTKIMALSDLIRNEYEQFEDEPLFINLHKSANELDQVIHKIIKHGEDS
jgi:PAS domain S-box-containing protein